MKAFIAIAACALGAAAASGFDSEAWLVRRAALDEDAQRMRGVWSNCAMRATSPAEGLVLPLELHPDGSPKFTLRAAKAQMFVEGRTRLVWAEGVEGTMYDERGAVAGRATVESCAVDLNAKRGWGEGRARLVCGAYSLEGEGLYFSQPDEFAKIMHGASMSAAGPDDGGRAAKALGHGRAKRRKDGRKESVK